uniref:Uncharacterized protein n=1 Tax=Rhizobium rhizogenes TaxID=359 RepID=A0A7S4ZU97_RHIRH|nr:hypothetical protein pC5.8b_241 [Rhizobium rhizogenes]
MAAQIALSKLNKSPPGAPSPPSASTTTPSEISRSAQIRAGLLGRSQSKTERPNPSSVQ